MNGQQKKRQEIIVTQLFWSFFAVLYDTIFWKPSLGWFVHPGGESEPTATSAP
jgi:hypothetical protein